MSEVIKLSSPETHEFWEIHVLYEDDHLLALDKPSGLATVSEAPQAQLPNLLGLLHAGIAQSKSWARDRGLTYLMNADRLDPGVSGLLLLAKNKSILEPLANLFGNEKPCKRFIALVQGSPSQQQFTVEAKLAPHPLQAGKMRVDVQGGKRARSSFQILERFAGWTLLTCEPLTYRPHQLRVHLQRARLPLVGDPLYGGPPLLLSKLKPGYRLKSRHSERPLIDRPALHAQEMVFPHPVSGIPVTIRAPWPKDLSVAVKYLRRYASAPPERIL
jgi:RluA family pseudouridine synthase